MSNLITEVAQYLAAQGLGTVGTNIFYSYAPDNEVTGLYVMDTGGPQPDKYLPTKEPTFQVFIRAEDYNTGKTLLDSVRSALHQQKNVRLVANQTYFYFILAVSEGGHIGRNESGFDEFSMNFQCRTR